MNDHPIISPLIDTIPYIPDDVWCHILLYIPIRDCINTFCIPRMLLNKRVNETYQAKKKLGTRHQNRQVFVVTTENDVVSTKILPFSLCREYEIIRNCQEIGYHDRKNKTLILSALDVMQLVAQPRDKETPPIADRDLLHMYNLCMRHLWIKIAYIQFEREVVSRWDTEIFFTYKGYLESDGERLCSNEVVNIICGYILGRWTFFEHLYPREEYPEANI